MVLSFTKNMEKCSYWLIYFLSCCAIEEYGLVILKSSLGVYLMSHLIDTTSLQSGGAVMCARVRVVFGNGEYCYPSLEISISYVIVATCWTSQGNVVLIFKFFGM